MSFFQFYGDIMQWVLPILYGVLQLRDRKWKELTLFAIVAISTKIILEVMKAVTHVDRPPEHLIVSDTFAFPSGHTMSAFLPVAQFFFLGRFKQGCRWGIAALFVGVARYMVHAHTIDQVCFGLLLSFWMTYLIRHTFHQFGYRLN